MNRKNALEIRVFGVVQEPQRSYGVNAIIGKEQVLQIGQGYSVRVNPFFMFADLLRDGKQVLGKESTPITRNIPVTGHLLVRLPLEDKQFKPVRRPTRLIIQRI